jgi:hypothetical protein
MHGFSKTKMVIESFGRKPQIDSDRITYGHLIGERFSRAGPTLKRGSTAELVGPTVSLGIGGVASRGILMMAGHEEGIERD